MYNQQTPSKSTAQTIPIVTTVSLLVSRIVSKNEGEAVVTVINRSSYKTVISITDGTPPGVVIST